MRSNKMQIYKCIFCGNIIEVVHAGGGKLVCCGKFMELQKENIIDASKETHIPLVEKVTGGYKIKVGKILHSMKEDHYIEWIDVIVGDIVIYRRYLSIDQLPEILFLYHESVPISARAYCNLHGLWKI